ncbi:alpha/beta-hydrolase [Obba rivulosa]|uniref:Alpha/beta-hydrolase n=1 Tax=Obba rivulosa TaxID=1052685 RepID=A0A8E2AIG4_9APHY|nr:alpha/beta-hydrolase [Obba rivulosa]
MFTLRILVLAIFGLRTVPAAPASLQSGKREESDGSTSVISQSTISNDFQRPALFSRAAYCPISQVATWTCGPSCDALPGVEVLASGGDNEEIPDFFIAHDTSTNTIVVAHQGTDPDNLLSDLNDVEIAKSNLNSTLFPNAGSDIEVHDGFQDTQGRTADLVLSTVLSALSSSGATEVEVTGHSLGAAVASLDAVMLKMHLPSDVSITTTVFGLPRAGNQAWADLVDSLLGSSFAHISNQHDPVPIVPGQFLGFQHPSGEAHITDVASSGQATIEACPGQENEHCSDANSLFDFSIQNHLGPYFNGISFGASAC